VVQCFLTIACNNKNALQILSDPRSPRVHLSRSIRVAGHSRSTHPLTQGDGQRRWQKVSSKGFGSVIANGGFGETGAWRTKGENQGARAYADSLEEVENGHNRVAAALWRVPRSPIDALTDRPGIRGLVGEMHLSTELQPTCTFPLFRIQV